VAERQGFEPWIPCGIHAFQACAFSHSAISPHWLDSLQSNTSAKGFALVVIDLDWDGVSLHSL
jgi:hypothetical protein